MKDAGFSAKELLQAGFSVGELKNAGFSAKELKAAGVSAADLRNAGFAAKDLLEAGYSPKDLKDAGFTTGDLIRAGADLSDVLGNQSDSDSAFSCDITYLTNLKNKHLPLPPEAKNCDLNTLKQVGFSAADLLNAGFSQNDLANAGFTNAEIQKAMQDNTFSCNLSYLKNLKRRNAPLPPEAKKCDVKTLKNAGFTASQLLEAGFSPSELKKAGFTTDELIKAVSTPSQNSSNSDDDSAVNTEKAKCDHVSLVHDKLSGFAPNKNCKIEDLKSAGYTNSDLLAAGFSQNDIDNALDVNDPNYEIKARLQKMRDQQEQAMAAQEMANKISDVQNNMDTQSSELLSTWTNLPHQQYAAGENLQNLNELNSSNRMDNGNAATSGKILKAGTILLAVLDTGINSDDKSPIMATITQGDYQGAKLLGEFSRTEKRVVLKFSTMSIKDLPTSISLNAYAIDTNTAHVAMASSVDSHYLLRYGTLFASSFLEGLGEAITQSGSTKVDTTSGNITEIVRNLSTSEKAISALGKVGENFSRELSSVYHTPPTVKVNAGTQIGILLMSDLNIPTNNN